MDVDGLIDAVEKAVQGFEPVVILPAVHILVVDIDNALSESFNCELRNTGFPDSGRTVEEDWISRLSVKDRPQDA
jgi:hypothetical protein